MIAKFPDAEHIPAWEIVQYNGLRSFILNLRHIHGDSESPLDLLPGMT